MNEDDAQYQEEQHAAVSGRGQHFGTGMTEAPGTEDSPGLQAQAAKYRAMTPQAVMPTSSGNGMSAEMFQGTLGGKLKVQNGMAANQWDIAKWVDQ